MESCPLCSCPQGTLAHVINFCPVALTQSRITCRHDSVQNFLFSGTRKDATKDIEMYSDLPGKTVNNTVKYDSIKSDLEELGWKVFLVPPDDKS